MSDRHIWRIRWETRHEGVGSFGGVIRQPFDSRLEASREAARLSQEEPERVNEIFGGDPKPVHYIVVARPASDADIYNPEWMSDDDD